MSPFERSSYTCKRDKCEACGKKKFPQYHFCRSCYLLLPREMQRALYSKTDGSAYNAALNFLNQLQAKLF